MSKSATEPWHLGADIPLRVIRRFARAVAERFRPDKIILFGSRAYGTPHADSDVDLLVIMPARDRHSQAVRILWRLAAPFPVDLIVRPPQEIAWRIFTKGIAAADAVKLVKLDGDRELGLWVLDAVAIVG